MSDYIYIYIYNGVFSIRIVSIFYHSTLRFELSVGRWGHTETKLQIGRLLAG